MNNNNKGHKMITWNINQATNLYGTNSIPEFLIKELKQRRPGIFVLTEFAFCKGATTFLVNLSEEYDFFPREATENTRNRQNEILVAWRKDSFECKVEYSKNEIVTHKNNRPNFVKVILVEKQTQKEIVVAGVRITMAKNIPQGLDRLQMKKAYQEQARLRREQMEYIYKSLETFPTVIIMGDLNNYRRGVNVEEWNINKITCNRSEYCIYTPSGQSIYSENQTDEAYQFAEDHFIAKGCSVENYFYDRSFMKLDEKVYNRGEDFGDRKDIIGYPDHAILQGELFF